MVLPPVNRYRRYHPTARVRRHPPFCRAVATPPLQFSVSHACRVSSPPCSRLRSLSAPPPPFPIRTIAVHACRLRSPSAPSPSTLVASVPHPHQRFCTSAHHPRIAPTPVCCPASHRGLGQAPHACVGQPSFPLISFAQAPESHHPRCQSRRKPSAPLRSGTTTSFQTPRPRNVVASHAGMGGVSAVSRPAVVLLLWVESCTSLLSRLARSSPKSCLRRPLHFTSLLALAGGRGSGASCRTPSETLQPFRERCCSCSCRRPCYQPERACVGGARQFQCTAWIQFSISELHIQLPLSQIDCIRLFLTSPFHSSTSATGVTKQVSL
jgi:hypothetical protein